jgi:hypothetical protein
LETVSRPFVFKQCISLIKSTGEKAKNLRQLRDLIETVSDESIYHHTYHYFLKRKILEYSNDFAHWAVESLEERALSEAFSNFDPFLFKDIHNLRKALLEIIDDYLKKYPEPREAWPNSEFFFNEAVILVYPVVLRANNLAEFLIAIRYIDPPSLYYHFYEARARLGSAADDFSSWVEEALGRKDLAAKIRGIDPLMHTLEGIRDHLVELVDEEVKRDMEVLPL